MVVKGGSGLLVGVTGAAGFIILALINLFIFTFDRFMTKESIEMGLKSLP